jgi:hypothetical protein
MGSFSIKIGDADHGPYETEADVTAALGNYRVNHPNDPQFTRVTVSELPGGGERSVWDFVEHEREFDIDTEPI